MVKILIRTAIWRLKIDYRAGIKICLSGIALNMNQDTIYDLDQVAVMGFQKISCIEFHVSIGADELPVFTAGHHLATYVRSFECTAGNWDNTATDDFSATYYTMWDDTNLYVAVSCEDNNYQFAGPNANDGDALQFTITATANERNYDGKMYIPTIAPRDPSSGQAVAQNNLPGPFIQTDLFAHEGTQYAGSVDDDTQDWMAEVKIPWAAMQGDFLTDVFPPALFDQIGFSVITIDYDVDYDGNPELQSIGSTHPGDWPWSPWPWSSGDTQETMTFIE